MIQVNREEFLHKLEQISPGLSPKEIVEQSSCVIFKDEQLHSFNEEIACSIPSSLPKEINGAVQAQPLIAQLRKWNEEVVELKFTKSELQIKGKGRQAGIRMSSEILLPLEVVEKPTKWHKLHEDFVDGIGMVESCASTDENYFNRTCVHITPKFMEAFDNYQLTRYEVETPLKQGLLVRRDAIKHVQTRDLTSISESGVWLHFKGSSGLRFSCQKYDEDYEDLSAAINMKGSKIVLPKTLAEEMARAEVCTAENQDSNLVKVEIIPGKMRIRGDGASSWFTAVKKLKYDGKPRKFMIAPSLMIELLKRHTECLITDDKIKVDGGRFVYVASLDEVESKSSKPTKDEDPD